MIGVMPKRRAEAAGRVWRWVREVALASVYVLAIMGGLLVLAAFGIADRVIPNPNKRINTR
jgi:hypothetical protein